VPAERCEEQATLGHGVVAAITKVYNAKRDIDEAREKKIDAALLVIALHKARTAEQHTFAGLDKHKKGHGYRSISA
jgi:hypothetical protein